MSCHLPMSRIKTIMGSSAEVQTISKDSLHLVTMATELFLKHLATKAADEANANEINYKHIAEVVNSSEKYEFLTEIIPRKITVRQYKEMMRKKYNSSTENSENSESDSSMSDSESSDSRSTHSEKTENLQENRKSK